MHNTKARLNSLPIANPCYSQKDSLLLMMLQKPPCCASDVEFCLSYYKDAKPHRKEVKGTISCHNYVPSSSIRQLARKSIPAGAIRLISVCRTIGMEERANM